MKNRAVFLDRDGNLNKDVGYPHSYQQIEIYPFSYTAVRKINQAGFLAIVITNQSGIGRGLIQESGLNKIHTRMTEAFAKKGGRIDAIYFCPHYEKSNDPKYKKTCSCRKPNPGMGLLAAEEFDIDLKKSYMVGDKVEDVLFGLELKSTSILVLTGFGKNSLVELRKRGLEPGYVASDVLDAVNWIRKREKTASAKPGPD